VKLLSRVLFYILLTAFAFTLVLAGNFLTLPTHNTSATHFDSLIVLGTPSNLDGTPSPEQRERVLEGVREYQAGVAPQIIMSGAAAHNSYVEAHTMALFAIRQGVPASAILEEPRARNTIQNIFYSAKLMHQHNWSSAEIISSPNHLPRAGLIVNALNIAQPGLSIDWRTHPSQWPPEDSPARKFNFYTGEALYCLQLRIRGFPPSQFPPAH
jgi:uncharacterized SAM-binding protein YcdF (DUF218 family)